jgi:hypothetical protein
MRQMNWGMICAGVFGCLASACVVADPPSMEIPVPSATVAGGKGPVDGGAEEKRVQPNSADADAEAFADAVDAERAEPRDSASETDGPDAAFSCSGWVAPDPPRNCSKSGGNGKCDTTCTKGDTTWKSECQDATCACKLNNQTMCMCVTTAVDGCGSCCPGMP